MVIDVNGNPQSGRQMGLPGPGWAEEITFSLPVTKSRVPRWAIRSRFRPRAWSKSNSSNVLRPGKRAARIRPSPLALGEEFVECGLVLRPEPDL